MAGNILGLLFKIGVDPADAIKGLDALKASFSTGLKEGASSANKELQKTGQELGNLLTPLNQARSGFNEVFSGDALQGTINLTRAFGPLGIAIGGVAVAAAGLGFAIKGAVDAAKDIGTRSKDDFDELQKKVQSAGESITEVQRAMAQGVVAALDKISGATTAFFAKVLEKDGPALIALLNEVATFITGTLIPLVDQFGGRFADGIANIIALWRTLNHEFSAGDFLKGLPNLQEVFDKNLADVKAQIAVITATIPAATFAPEKQKKARQDLTDAALEQAKAEHALSLVQQEAAVAKREIDDDEKKGLITQEEGAKRRLAVLAEVQKAELAALDARQKAVQSDTRLLPNQRASQLDDIETQRAQLRLKAGDAQDQENRRQIEADQKLHDAFTAGFAKLRLEWLSYAEFLHKTTDDIVKGLAQQGREIPGGFSHVLGLDDPDKIKKQLDIIHFHFSNFFEQLKTAFSAQGAAGLVQSLSEQLAKAIQDLPLDLVRAFTDSFKTLLDVFIETGHTGPAVMKQFVAAVLRAIGTLASNFAALFFGLAIGYAALGDWVDAALFAAAGAALTLLAVGLGYAASKVAPSKASSAAGAGGGFGGDTSQQAPGTVTINQGATSALGIQLGILSALQNITTAPPGDILQRGADQNPMAVGQANNEAARRDGSVSREFLQISGLRTA